MLHTLLLLLFALLLNSLGEDSITLSSENEFTDFVNDVNSGSTYSGTTVYLGTDITLSGSIDPIGKDDNYYFLGVFDGQGHIISSLTINSPSTFTGLFGYSDGLTIKNVVLDDSCFITSTFTGSDNVNVGGIIGYCEADSGKFDIENSVNMAGVSFDGKTTGSSGILFIGGVVGRLLSKSYNIYVKNCVNYGSVTDSGTVSEWAYLGGIVGYSDSFSSPSYNCYIQNCLNYGTITYVGTSDILYDGGVVGYSYGTYIENCVSAGKITTQTAASKNNCIGSIVGDIDSSNTFINYCYYTSDVTVNSLYGTGTPSSTTGTPTSSTSVDSELVSKMNSNATSCNWSKWLLNTNNATVTFKMSGDKELSFSSQIILIPNPVKEGNSFLFWCKDAECTEKFDPETGSVSGITDLYAAWIPNNYTLTFDFDNGTTVNETFTYNTEIVYPDMKKKEGYTLSWSNYHELMPARDITVTAQWAPNNYAVTFDGNGGSVSETSKIVTFNEKYGDLPTPPKKEGYMFLGWFTSEINGTEVTNETIVTIPHNHTLYAHWEEVTTQVEIVFSTKDLTKEEVKAFIEQYTNADFEITYFEKSSESDELTVIIGFADKEDAERFFDEINKLGENVGIKQVKFVFSDDSFSTTTYPLIFLSTLFL